MSLHQAIWKRAEAIDPNTMDIGNMYISPTVSAVIETLSDQLRDLHGRDRAESAKLLKFKKKASEESDEDFNAEAVYEKIESINIVTKQNITVFQGKIRSPVEECCKTHNSSVMDDDARKREAMLKEVRSE